MLSFKILHLSLTLGSTRVISAYPKSVLSQLYCLSSVPVQSLYAKLLTDTRTEKSQICKSQLFEILYILFCITLLHPIAVNFLPAFTIFSFQAGVVFKEHIQLTNVENEIHCPKNKVSSVMSFIYFASNSNAPPATMTTWALGEP